MAKSSTKKSRRTTNSTNEDDSEKEYQVEAILDKRTHGKKTQYLLKWKGYSNKHNSWEDEKRLNCPDLFRQFEANWKRKNNKRKISSESSKDSSSEEFNEDYQTVDDDDQSMASENEDNRLVTRQSTRKKPRLSQSNNTNNNNASSSFGQRHSTRKIIDQTKSRITSMSRNDSSTDDDNDDIYQQNSSPKKSTRSNRKLSNETSINTVDDNNENINRVTLQSRKTITKKSNKKTPRLRIVPSTASSISYTYNSRENTNRNCDKSSKNYINEIIDETNQVEQIETVRNDHNEILFRIKFFDEDEPQWVSSKIANRKYPQAVISFWESHVEFT